MVILSVAVLGALIPTLVYVLFVWWLDRFEKEPLWLLALAFLWGAGPAALLSLGFELRLQELLVAQGGGLQAGLLGIGLGAPLIEETFKGVALLGLVWLFPREFDDVLDGIIYGAMIGLGFAMTENVFGYFVPILTGLGITAGLLNILMRAIVFGTNHAFWTGITGAAVGYARLEKRPARRLLLPLGGWAIAVLVHSIHNVAISTAQQAVCLSLGLGLLVNWGGVALLLLVAASALRRETRWIEQGLAEEVESGLLSKREYDLLRTPGKRLWRRWQAYREGGRIAYRSVGCYFQTATELAFRKQKYEEDPLPDKGVRARGEDKRATEIRRLRQELAACRNNAWFWLERLELLGP
jgi:RsiW-degrading membrane proteinase PrsW (M82 family)